MNTKNDAQLARHDKAKDYQGEARELIRRAYSIARRLVQADQYEKLAHVMANDCQLASLLEARDQLRELQVFLKVETDKEHRVRLSLENKELRSQLTALRQRSGALYNWIQGNVTIDERTRDVMNRLYGELDKGAELTATFIERDHLDKVRLAALHELRQGMENYYESPHMLKLHRILANSDPLGTFNGPTENTKQTEKGK
jgi:hypothetical protein